MAQVTLPQMQMNPRQLADIANVQVDYMPDVWDWQQRASQMDQTGLEDVMRAAQHEKVMDPIRVQRGQADLESVLANTEGTKLDNTSKGYKNELAQHLLPQEKITQFKELVLKGTEADRKSAEENIYKMLRDQDPNVRAMGKQLQGSLKSVLDDEAKKATEWKYRQKELNMTEGGANARQKALFEHQKELETMRTGRATAVAAIGAAARKAKLDAGANPKKWQELAVSLSVELRNTTDPEVKAAIAEELSFAQQMAERLAPVPAPQVDPTKVGDGRLRDPRGAMPAPPGTNKPKPGSSPDNPIILK